MEKNLQIEIELSEEQLQEITGGCVKCASDLKKFPQKLAIAQNQISLSEAAKANNNNWVAAGLQNLANLRLNEADALLDNVAARGHRPPVPNLNLPAPRN
jgi:bacteriocin-like protein